MVESLSESKREHKDVESEFDENRNMYLQSGGETTTRLVSYVSLQLPRNNIVSEISKIQKTPKYSHNMQGVLQKSHCSFNPI